MDWSKKGSNTFPLSEKGLPWKTSSFKALGIVFHLNTKYMFDLNYKVKLKQIEQSLNCWRARNLSLIGKICVIKSLLLPQLLYQFSVLCIKIPKSFFDALDKLFLNLFGMGEMIGLKEKLCAWIILMVV